MVEEWVAARILRAVAEGSRATLTDGPIGPALAGLAVPMSIGIVFLILLNLVDTYFVGQLGTQELAAMSFTFPVITLVMSVTMGLSVGTTSAVSRAIGAGDERAVRRLTTHALFLAGAVVIVISVAGVLTQDYIFTALGAEEEILPLLREYMTIWFAGAAFLVVPMVGNGVLRAGGDAKTPMYMMMVAAAVNGALDPILIFGLAGAPALGLAGAAIATLVARSVTLVVAFVFLKRRNMLDLHIPGVSELMDSWKKIVSVGVPAAITNALGPVATAVMTALIATEGHEAVAAYGVGSRVEGLLLIAPFGLTAALTPFIGQNWGAHHVERVATGLKLSNRFVFAWGVAAWVVLIFAGGLLASVFTDDAQVIGYVRDYLWIVPLSYASSGLVSVASAAFNAVDRAVRSTLLSATKSLVLAVPLAFVGSALGGIQGIFAGIAAATVLTSVVATIWLRSLTRPEKEAHDPEAALSGIRRAEKEMQLSFDALIARLEGKPDLQIRPRPINTIGFYCRGREVGHVHRDGHIDLHVPPALGQQLIDEGLATHHRHRHEVAWVSHKLETASDATEAARLVELALLTIRMVKSGPDAPETRATLERLDPSEGLRAAIDASVATIHARRAAASA